MTSNVEVQRRMREVKEEKANRTNALNELVGLYIQLSDAPPSERAQLRQAIYNTAGVDVTADGKDERVILSP